MLSALEALARLKAGNQQFVANISQPDVALQQRRGELVSGQEPFAIILGCSDSRVPAELVFGQGLGDLFVIRVAGNIIAPSLVGSVEFAAEAFGTRLVVVLGHTSCGAISATVDQLQRPTGNRSPNRHAIVDRIRPVVDPLMQACPHASPEDIKQRAGRANIVASASQLRHGSHILETLIENDALMVVGAEYSLETGEVDFFDGIPEA